MRIFEIFKKLFKKDKRILWELREIKLETVEMKINQSVFTKEMYELGKKLLDSSENQTKALNNFLKINEQFVQNMTRYFNFELSQMEKMAAKEAPEKTEHDGQF